jgi:hypothetical protein
VGYHTQLERGPEAFRGLRHQFSGAPVEDDAVASDELEGDDLSLLVTSMVGTVVGAFFGVQVGTQGKAEAEAARDDAQKKAEAPCKRYGPTNRTSFGRSTRSNASRGKEDYRVLAFKTPEGR